MEGIWSPRLHSEYSPHSSMPQQVQGEIQAPVLNEILHTSLNDVSQRNKKISSKSQSNQKTPSKK